MSAGSEKRAAYPFAAIAGQEEMKLALLLAAVDWRLGVLLRGDKGSGKTTAARGLAALLPAFLEGRPARFVNVPIGVTEDRLLGGLDLERAMRGEPALKTGLLTEAHGGVLYLDEVNLLPGHLGDALLDAAASGMHTVEREGFSASGVAEFCLLGSMNPEEGSLRPQLLDRFALSVDVGAPLEAAERLEVVGRRVRFERGEFQAEWEREQVGLREKIAGARERLRSVRCPEAMLLAVSERVCAAGVRSLRADLAGVRAATACAALAGAEAVTEEHVEAVMGMVLGHRGARAKSPGSSPQAAPPKPEAPKPQPPGSKSPTPDAGQQESSSSDGEAGAGKSVVERVFAPYARDGVRVAAVQGEEKGAVVGSRAAADPAEVDVRGSLVRAVRETGAAQLAAGGLQERVRAGGAGTRFVVVVDSSGSHAVQERMRGVKGALEAVLTRSFRRGDEVGIVVFRGTGAQVLVEPTGVLAEALVALEYVPTGGRTPLAAGLRAGLGMCSEKSLVLVVTDGRANVGETGEAWGDALAVARAFTGVKGLVVDTEAGVNARGQARELAEVLGWRCIGLDELAVAGEVRV